MEVKELYNAKIRTGKYDDYPPEALTMLWEDCVRQIATMKAINSRRDNNDRPKTRK